MNPSPGPANFYEMTRTLAQGTYAGFAATAGLAIGCCRRVRTFRTIQLLPCGLHFIENRRRKLSYIFGVRTFQNSISRGKNLKELESGEMTREIFFQSELIEASNPKTALFPLALLPQFVVTKAGPATPQFLFFGLIVTLSPIPCDLFVVFFADKAASLNRDKRNFRDKLNKISGTILISLGAYVLLDEND